MNADIAIQTKGRWPDIIPHFGIDPQYLKNRHGPCPICQGRDRFRFDNKTGNGSYFCSGCGAGDGLSLVMKYCGIDFKTAANEIRKIIGVCKMTTTASSPDTAENKARLKRIHVGLHRITPCGFAQTYFKGRGIHVLPERDCFYHHDFRYNEDSAPNRAIVTAFRDIYGKLSTYHVTYLGDDGNKLDCKVPKRILPVVLPLPGCAMKLFDSADILGVTEGIETALAVYQDQNIPVWAAGNASQMAALKIPASVKTVWIYPDSDENFTGLKAAATLAKRMVEEGKTVRIVHLIDGQPVDDYGKKFDYNDYVSSKAAD